jgi:hypothetical protein
MLCLWMPRSDFGSIKQPQTLQTLLSFMVLDCRKGNALGKLTKEEP